MHVRAATTPSLISSDSTNQIARSSPLVSNRVWCCELSPLFKASGVTTASFRMVYPLRSFVRAGLRVAADLYGRGFNVVVLVAVGLILPWTLRTLAKKYLS